MRPMRRRHPALPRYWLMTDERMGNGLPAALRRLPKGRAAIVFRHYATEGGKRRQLFKAVLEIARRNRLLLLLAGTARQARAWKADGWHGPGSAPVCGHLVHSMSAHDAAELETARRSGADLVFLSPVFPTRSHPGAKPLGPVRFGLLARRANIPVIALGGMTSRRARHVRMLGAHGYAAIDHWLK